MSWRDRISVDPSVCHGRVCIKGTRVMVSHPRQSGPANSRGDHAGYHIGREDIEAAMHYAAEASIYWSELIRADQKRKVESGSTFCCSKGWIPASPFQSQRSIGRKRNADSRSGSARRSLSNDADSPVVVLESEPVQ